MTPLDVVKTRLQTQEVAPLEFPVYEHARGYAVNGTRMCEEFAGRNSIRFASLMSQHSDACIQMPGRCICGFELVQQRPMHGMWDGIYKIFRYEGMRGLWRGLVPTVVMTVPSQVTYMTCYDAFRGVLSRITLRERSDAPYKIPQFAVSLGSGASARAISATMVTPIELLRTRLQASHSKDGMSMVLRGFGDEIRAQGITVLWRGLCATLWRDVPFSAIYFASYEAGKRMLTGGGLGESRTGGFSQEFAVSFAVGSSSGCIAALITHPFDVIKTRLQADSISSVDGARRMAIAEAITKIVRTEGARGLYCGLAPRLAKVVPASGIMIGSFEAVGRLLVRMRMRNDTH